MRHDIVAIIVACRARNGVEVYAGVSAAPVAFHEDDTSRYRSHHPRFSTVRRSDLPLFRWISRVTRWPLRAGVAEARDLDLRTHPGIAPGSPSTVNPPSRLWHALTIPCSRTPGGGAFYNQKHPDLIEHSYNQKVSRHHERAEHEVPPYHCFPCGMSHQTKQNSRVSTLNQPSHAFGL